MKPILHKLKAINLKSTLGNNCQYMARFVRGFIDKQVARHKNKQKKPIPLWLKAAYNQPQLLEGRLQNALQLIKRALGQHTQQDLKLDHLPWYLFIGAKDSGKTSLLANSTLNLSLAKELSVPVTSENCEWWVSKDAVLIDVPGAFTTTDNQGSNAWQQTLAVLKKYRGRRALAGIVITLALPELLEHHHHPLRERFAQQLALRISELKAQFGSQLPFYFAITKCDLMPGFQTFFSDCSTEELAQPWGFNLPNLNQGISLINVFSDRFNALIRKLNKQLIWRLHQERDPHARPAIKDFPLQVEQLKEALIEYVKVLTTSSSSSFNLQGVYLSSALQPDNTDRRVHTTTENSQTLQIMQAPTIQGRSYFIRQFILKALNYTSQQSSSSQQPAIGFTHSPLLQGIALSVLIAVSLVLGSDFLNGAKETYAIKHGLAKYQQHLKQAPNGDLSLNKALPLLASLEHAAIHSPHVLFAHSDKAQRAANSAYQQALTSIILPKVKSDLENMVNRANSAEQLYASLKAYLMLGDANYFNSDYLLHTASLSIANSKKAEQIKHYLQAALAHPHPLSLNNELIAHARKQLLSLPAIELNSVLVKNADPFQNNWVLGDTVASAVAAAQAPAAALRHMRANVSI